MALTRDFKETVLARAQRDALRQRRRFDPSQQLTYNLTYT